MAKSKASVWPLIARARPQDRPRAWLDRHQTPTFCKDRPALLVCLSEAGDSSSRSHLCGSSSAEGETEPFAWKCISSPTTALFNIYDIDIVVSVARGRECDALAVGRPGRKVAVCESGPVFSVGIYDIDSPAAVECDALAVGRPRRIPAVCESGLVFSVGIHDIDSRSHVMSRRGFRSAEADECDALAVVRPRRTLVRPIRILVMDSVVCESGLVFSVGIHDIDSPADGECDALAVGRPRRKPAICESGPVFSVGIHDIDSPVAEGVDCDALAVGRPRRMPVTGRVVCESGPVFSVGIHDIDLIIPVSV